MGNMPKLIRTRGRGKSGGENLEEGSPVPPFHEGVAKCRSRVSKPTKSNFAGDRLFAKKLAAL